MMAEDVCPWCGGSPESTRIDARETMQPSHEPFAYWRCSHCGSLWVADPPQDIGAYYADSYYSLEADPEVTIGRLPARPAAALVVRSSLFGQSLIAGAADRLAPRREVRTLVSICRAVRAAGLPHGAASRVLDVGAGSGLLVYALSLGGMVDVTGTDPFGPGDRVFDTGARLRRLRVDELNGTWDLVMLHHTLEHVADPVQLLAACRERLTDQGRILVRVPTVSSWAWRAYGVDWSGLDPPRHLAVPSRHGLQEAATRAGLRVVHVHDDSTGFQFWGSEQVRLGIGLQDDCSVMVTPRGSPFPHRQLREWERRARALNHLGEGDQVAAVLVP